MQLCWTGNPTRRASFGEIRKLLSGVLEMATNSEFYLDISHVNDAVSETNVNVDNEI